MTSITTTALETPTTSSLPAVFKEDPPAAAMSQARLEAERPAFEVTSNVRQGSGTPGPSSAPTGDVFLPQHARDPVADDPVFGLPPPDLAPRFLFRRDVSYDEDTPSIPINDASSDTTTPSRTPVYTPSSPPPRIYFGPSAITFAPPASYDFLERDPSVKGVPRNYRAWARAGRPRLDVEGAERLDAKYDFRAIGLVYPQDSGSEDEGEEGVEAEKRKKRRKKKQAARLAVPMDRPRRTVRKLMETAPSGTPPLRTRVNEGTETEASAKAVIAVQTMDGAKARPSSKLTEESNSSARRSSSTLLDTDLPDKGKRKRLDSDKEGSGIPAAKKLRVSKRLHAKKYGLPSGSTSSQSASGEDEEDDEDSCSDFTPSPASPAANDRRAAAPNGWRQSASPASRSTPRKPPASRQPAKPAVAGPSRSGLLPTSRPGHRLSRELQQNSSASIPTRTFPPSVSPIPGYPGFYRRYPLITQFHADDPLGQHINQNDTQPKRTLGNWNPPRDHRDLYTPRYTKGSGGKKIALCPICFEDSARGGEGRQEWNHTKTSQHNYHMQYYHGISATRCAPFSPPTAHRISPVPRPQTNEKSQILQGKCHVCKQWIPLEGCKLGELKVKELLWWKHAAQCHKDSKLPGEDNIFMDDDAYFRLKGYEGGLTAQEA